MTGLARAIAGRVAADLVDAVQRSFAIDVGATRETSRAPRAGTAAVDVALRPILPIVRAVRRIRPGIGVGVGVRIRVAVGVGVPVRIGGRFHLAATEEQSRCDRDHVRRYPTDRAPNKGSPPTFWDGEPDPGLILGPTERLTPGAAPV